MIPATDIDIDTADRNRVLELFPHTVAVIKRDNKTVKHNTGVYFHKMPSEPFTGMATIDHKEAEDRGFFKLDILNLSLYKNIKTPEQLDELMEIEPKWDLLAHDEFIDMLFHVKGHGDILRKLKPTNITQLAAVLAIIRPAKRHLVDSDWDTIMKQVWIPPTDGTYYFKKSHAVAYAHVVVVQMNQLVDTLT